MSARDKAPGRYPVHRLFHMSDKSVKKLLQRGTNDRALWRIADWITGKADERPANDKR